MKKQNIALMLTVINLVLMTILLAQLHPAMAKQNSKSPGVLRGSGLEIVDNSGKVRASITIQPPVVVGGKQYPETVLLRLINVESKPMVKVGAGDKGSGMSLIDYNDQGIIINAHDTGSYFKLYNKGQEKIIKL